MPAELVGAKVTANGRAELREALASAARFVLAIALLLLTAAIGWATEPQAKAEAPENHVELKDTVSGGYFIAKPLKDEYDRLLARLRALKADIDAGRTTGADALRDLRTVQADLDRLRKEIEEKRVFVPIAKSQTQTETFTFELGKERLLVITADNIRVIGWDQPGVKCELEKTVLSPGEQPADDDLMAIKVVHQHGSAASKVGKSAAEVEAEEKAFLASPDGSKLTPEQRAGRRKLLDEIAGHYAIYGAFQGKDVDTLEISGLTHEQGNRQVSLEVSSKGGTHSHRSVWRRHAKLTVYVPRCNSVAVRGGQVALDAQNITANLVVTGDDAHDRDYHGEFKVRDVHGSVLVQETPLQVIERIDGNVMITALQDFANSGITHDGSEAGPAVRFFHHYAPLNCTCKDIAGDLIASFGRVELHLENVRGRLDVRNEFGDTIFTIAKPLAKQAHRIVSEAGRVEVDAPANVLPELSLWAITSHGNVRTNAPPETLDDFHYGGKHSWAGFRAAKSGAQDDFFAAMERPGRAYRGENRAPGLDLVSRGGTVIVNVR